MKILTVVGARPQFVKASAISSLVSSYGIEEVLVHTGQHFDYNMSRMFFEDLDIPEPKYTLGINSLSHGSMTGRMIEELEKVMILEKPNSVLVYGDTNSTMATALSASKLQIPIIHIEAGERSYWRRMPEEINRVVTDVLSTLLFCSSGPAVSNLRKEGIIKGVYNSGDVMYDVFCKNKDKISSRPIVEKLHLIPKEYVVLTLHREENLEDPVKLENFFSFVSNLSERKGFEIVCPMHPRTLKILQNFSSIRVLPPVSYLDMMKLVKDCKFVMTDSGGLQKEAFWSGVFCITLRDQTEWIDLVRLKCNVLTGLDHTKISASLNMGVGCTFVHKIYGDGKSAELILKVISEQINKEK